MMGMGGARSCYLWACCPTKEFGGVAGISSLTM
jgi:hypothetical protein